MAYTSKNYRTKKDLIADHKAGVRIKCFQPGGIFPLATGANTLEGPHFPEPHKWYAAVEIGADGYLVPGSKIR